MGKLDQYKIAEEPFYQSQADEIEMYKAAYTNRMPVMLKARLAVASLDLLNIWHTH